MDRRRVLGLNFEKSLCIRSVENYESDLISNQGLNTLTATETIDQRFSTGVPR